MLLNAEAICEVVSVEPLDCRAFVTWLRLISPFEPSAEMMVFAVFDAQLPPDCIWIRADKVPLANWLEGVLEADEAVVAGVVEVEDAPVDVVDPVVFAEVPSAAAANCPVIPDRSDCRVDIIC
jgi:hypothetical protein